MARYVTRQLRRLDRAGLSERKQRWLAMISNATVLLFAVGWTVAVKEAIEDDRPLSAVSRITTNPLAPSGQPEAAFLLDAALAAIAKNAAAGESGALRVVIPEPGDTTPLGDSLPAGAELAYKPAGDPAAADVRYPGAAGGAWDVVLRIGDALRPVPGVRVLSLVPLSEAAGGRIGSYRVGSWPGRRVVKGVVYDPPPGLIRVERHQTDLRVSEHFVLGDFLTKGQESVWPKYVALSPRLLDKLELTLQALERMGHPVDNVGVISGFRTPQYNAGGGNTSGRGELSRHMYGDAADIFIDNDRDGRMDDLNGDGRVDIGDARVLAKAGEAVERTHPHLIGGIGTYRPTGAHSGFVHLDTRGYRARW